MDMGMNTVIVLSRVGEDLSVSFGKFEHYIYINNDSRNL